ncbi:alpha/beta hydrolase [Klenkia sp. LSe6-5]|uniref:Alpha/beta hydrolase n=1 Tax=Klenkia sesuvii TaxID=3103137 RepID=A0ABU8DV54_9ACTN
MTTGLSAVESWDLPALRGSVAELGGVPDQLAGWRGRLDGLRGRLRAADLWSGPAADVAATALVELSSVAGEVQHALVASADHLELVAVQAASAQEEVAAARAAAAGGPVELTDSGQVPPVAAPGMAEDQLLALAERERAASWAEAHARSALSAADAVLAGAQAAVAALHALDPGPVGAGFDGLAAAAAAVQPPPTVPTGPPSEVAAWWDGLTPAQRQAAVVADPAAVGARDGLPAWARDQANRLLLDDALAHPGRPGYDVAQQTAAQLAALATGSADRPGQLLRFDPGRDLVVVSVGDLDTAQAVGVLVPGMGTTPADLPALVHDASAVGELAVAAAPGLAVATVVWLGYRTPTVATVASSRAARLGGLALDAALDGLAAARGAAAAAGGPPPPRTTVLAHSYGTVVTGWAARAEGPLAADAVALLGSPGLPVVDASGLEVAEVHGAWTPFDPISYLGRFGASPSDPGFGDTPLPVTPVQLHTEYYDEHFPTVAALGEVVAGSRTGE